MKGFFAYPSAVSLVVQTIRTAAIQLAGIKTWEELDIPGKFITTEILSEINESDFLLADISRLNFNVVYEIGFAIGRKKRVVLFKNTAVSDETPTIQEVGIFDTLGYKTYSTSGELSAYLRQLSDVTPLPIDGPLNEKSPLYIVQPKTKTDHDGYLIASIKKSRLYYRSYDPTENSRLAGPDAIKNVAQSAGVILHFLPGELVDAKVHNIRSAFVAGLADGMEKRSLFVQTGETPIPIDLRDFVTQCGIQKDFKDAVDRLADQVYEDRGTQVRRVGRTGNALAAVDLGASAAENEITSLGEYYVEIDAFRRALRKEVRLVTGRKGSGKTAIFFMLRDRVRAQKSNVVLDLKPEGYQLMKLKDAVVDYLSGGTMEHTITAFWEYLLWLEMCHRIIEVDRELHKRNHEIYGPYQRLKELYSADGYSGEGDFSERLKDLMRHIVQAIEVNYEEGKNQELSVAQITELIHRHDLQSLKRALIDYLAHKESLWLLFDNVDKGWASQGVSAEDLVIVRSLIEATRKIERELQKSSLSAHTIVFLRNDVFEHLVNTTSDRGKETRANVDWDDPEMLREMLRRRLARNLDADKNTDFDTLWRSICVSSVDGQDSIEFLIQRCLMRPRSLLDLIGHCRGYALNLGHDKISGEDISKGCNAFSNDLLAEINLEIRDVFPNAQDLLYAFIGSRPTLEREELRKALAGHDVPEEDLAGVVNLLLWFGFLGFQWTDGSVRYIYSFMYNMKVLQGTHDKLLAAGTVKYSINPAFAPALGIS